MTRKKYEVKTRSEEVKDALAWLLSGVEDVETVKTILAPSKLGFTDDSDECGYPNLHIKIEGDTIRIYKTDNMKTFKVQLFRRVKLEWSGIPTFEPGRRVGCM